MKQSTTNFSYVSKEATREKSATTLPVISTQAQWRIFTLVLVICDLILLTLGFQAGLFDSDLRHRSVFSE